MNFITPRFSFVCFVSLLLFGRVLNAQNTDLPYSSGSTGADGPLAILTPPSQRYAAGMAYDSARQRTVLFGGYNGSSRLNDTWEWDGTNWARKTPTSQPTVRSDFGMTYDSTRQRVVLFGGTSGSGETWEWDGSNWVQKFPATSPSNRSGHALAYDATRQRVLLFGGGTGDTWEWDGTNWQQKAPTTSPPSRTSHGLAYDATRQRVVLFGGNQGGFSQLTSDTWEWDGTNWASKNPVTVPPGRNSHSMAYDSSRQRVVMFGGGSSSSPFSVNDTWEWDGVNWTQRSSTAPPSVRKNYGLVFDSNRQQIVCFGGSGTSTYNDVWEWDGTNWKMPHGGAFHVFDMSGKANGIWNYTSITIGSGVKMTFLRNSANSPVTWLATEDAKIDGELVLDGTQAPDNTIIPGTQGKGGPGGFDGGLGGTRFNSSGTYAGTPGQGPGGGTPGVTTGQAGTNANSNYGNLYLQPLVGGSGGGGSASTATVDGGNGGGGGGAILIASSKDITINAHLHANGATGSLGGSGTARGGTGSGGAIRLVADRLLGTGSISVTGATAGRIRYEGYIRSLLQTGAASTPPIASAPVTTASTGGSPTIAVTNVAGQPVTQPPSGNPNSPDVIFSSAGSITITVTTTNVPNNTPVTCRVTSGSQVINLPLAGDPAVTVTGGSATFTTTVQAGIGTVQAFCTFTAPP